MKGKIANSLKSPLTKRSSEIGYWELNEMGGSSGCHRQKKLIGYLRWGKKILNFWCKTIWGNYGKSAKWQRGCQIDEITYVKRRGYSKCVHMHTRGDVGSIEESVIRSACTKWKPPNKCYGILFVHWSGQIP